MSDTAKTGSDSGLVKSIQTAWPTLVTLAILTVALTFIVGPIGTVAGLTAATVWVLAGFPYAIAVGHVILTAAFSDGSTLETFVLVELAFLGVLVADIYRQTGSSPVTSVASASAVCLVGTGWVLSQSQPLWIAATAVLTLFVLAAYFLHRYELVRLGLVSVEQSTDTTEP